MPELTNIKIMEQIEYPCLSVSSTVNVANVTQVIEDTFKELSNYMTELKEHVAYAPFIRYDDYQKMYVDTIRVEMGFPVAKTLSNRGRIKASSIPSSKVISCMFVGDYNELNDMYFKMTRWLKETEYEPQGSAYLYKYNAEESFDRKLLSRIIIPIKANKHHFDMYY